MSRLSFIFSLFLAFGTGAVGNSKAPVAKKPAPKAPLAKTPAPLDINKLAEIIQKKYNSTAAASFSFEQSYKHPTFLSDQNGKGKVFFKAGKMLWRYLEPKDAQKEIYIVDKQSIYYRDKVAFKHDCFDQDTLSASITFLWKKGNLKNSFTISPSKNPNTNAIAWLTLIPKEKDGPAKSIILGVDPKTGVVKESIVVDASDGVNSFKFTDFVGHSKNNGIADSVFKFVPPPGVRVEPMPNVSCPVPAPKPTAKKI